MNVSVAGKQLKLSNVSAFTGKLKYRDSGKVKLCEACEEQPAMWQHQTTDRKRLVYLCFGCGGH